jgi:hypothetical protein
MTDYQKSKLPFNIVSSSVDSTYMTQLSSGFKPGVDIVGQHQDTYKGLENEPLQTTFTRTHVGGNQHRHIPINTGNDNDFNRPEAFKIQATASSLRIYGPDFEDVNKPRAQIWKGTKSPINIENIKSSGNLAGNYEYNYQVVNSVGRRTTNNLIVDGFIASGNLTTQFINQLNNAYYIFRLRDTYGDGWNGGQVQLRQGTTVIQTFTGPVTTSEDVSVVLPPGISYNLYDSFKCN